MSYMSYLLYPYRAIPNCSISKQTQRMCNVVPGTYLDETKGKADIRYIDIWSFALWSNFSNDQKLQTSMCSTKVYFLLKNLEIQITWNYYLKAFYKK